jgi:hypothetical protein
VRIERVLNGTAYATLVQTAAQTAKMGEGPITAESEAEKPTRAPRKKKEEQPAAERPVRDSGPVEGARGKREAAPTEEEAPVAEIEAKEPVATDEEPPKPKKKTRRGSRGGRNRRKKPAATAAAENGKAEEAPAAATIHVPSPELGQTSSTDGESADGEQPPKKKRTRRGSRGGRNRRKKPAAAASTEAKADPSGD